MNKKTQNNKSKNHWIFLMVFGIIMSFAAFSPSSEIGIGQGNKGVEKQFTWLNEANRQETSLSTQIADVFDNEFQYEKQNVDNQSVYSEVIFDEQYESEEKEGRIGIMNEEEEDKVSDNFFTIELPRKMDASSTVYLEYEVYGKGNSISISRSINKNISFGGDFQLVTPKWHLIREPINPYLLKKGKNSIHFTSPTVGLNYHVKNVKIGIEKKETPYFVSSSLFDNQLYVKGFIATEEERREILVGGEKVMAYWGEFEIVLPLTSLKEKNITLEFDGKIHHHIIGKPQKIDWQENSSRFVFKNIDLKAKEEIEYEGVRILGTENGRIEIGKLRAKDFPLPNKGIRSMMEEGSAYRVRMLGQDLSEQHGYTVHLPYDDKKVNAFSEKNVRPFYFDYQKRKWVPIKESKVHTDTKTVSFNIGAGDYDFINGIITTPESPQVAAFAPTSISEQPLANPTANLNVIAPPTANAQGDARLSYPIIIPKGTGGLQPSLSVDYNSGGGNGWLGEGWQLGGQSFIGIDTRWGSPKYDSQYETELYNIDGEMLVYAGNYLPHRHNDISETSTAFTTHPQRRDSLNAGNRKEFFLRKNHDFTKIVRYGNLPSNYRWVVTLPNGTKKYYGGDEQAVRGNAVIKTEEEHIAQWGLWKVEDVYGNKIEYTYQNNNSGGEAVFVLEQIKYGKLLQYRIDFVSHTGRADVAMNGKLGVKIMEPHLLKEIRISLNSQLIRAYQFNYGYGEFDKTLLSQIIEKDSRENEVQSFDLDYYNDLQTGGYSHYLSDYGVATPRLSRAIPLGAAHTQYSKISTDFSQGAGIHFRPGLGVDFLIPSFFNAYGDALKSFNYGSSKFTSEKAIQLIDFDGDGVSDILYKTPSGLFYSNGIAHGLASFGFGGSKKIQNVRRNISETVSRTTFSGSDGGIRVFSVGFNKSRITTQNNSDTNTYLIDANSDGLVDIVDNGEVWFNKREADHTKMTLYSDETENMVLTANKVKVHQSPVEELPDISKNDVVKMWIAPMDGVVIFRDGVQVENKNGASAIYSVEIKNPLDPTKNGRLYLNRLEPSMGVVQVIINRYNDYFSHISNLPPAHAQHHFGINSSQNLTVKKGDKIFVRLHKNGDANFKVTSNPHIYYIGTNGYPLPQGNYDASAFSLQYVDYHSNFLLNAKFRPLSFQNEGSVDIQVPAVNFAESHDDITFKIIQVEHTQGQETVLYSMDYPQSSTAFSTQPVALTTQIPQGGASIRFVVETDAQTRFHQNHWNNISVSYTPSGGTMTSYTAVAEYPSHYVTGFREKHDIKQGVTQLPSGIQDYGVQIKKPSTHPVGYLPNGSFSYVIKKNGAVIGKRKVINSNNTVVETDWDSQTVISGVQPIFIFSKDLENENISDEERLSIQVFTQTQQEKIFYKVYDSLYHFTPFQISYGATHQPFKSVGHTSVHAASLNHISLMYNNWGQFLYNESLDMVQAPKESLDPYIISPYTPTDSYGRLINREHIKDFEVNVSFNFAQCNQIDPNTPNYNQVYSDCLLDQINHPNSSAVSPASTASPILRMDPQKKAATEKWIGLGTEQYTMKDAFKDDETSYGFFNPVNNNPPNIYSQGNVKTKMEAINKKHYSQSITRTLSGTAIVVQQSSSEANTVGERSYLQQDFMDLNGDGYPDHVYKDKVQLSNATGGLYPQRNSYIDDWISKSYSYQKSRGASFNLKAYKTVGALMKNGFKDYKKSITDNSSPWSIGLSQDSDAKDTQKAFWMDINGDGLPDRITSNGHGDAQYRLNLGHKLHSRSEDFSHFRTISSRPSKGYGVSLSYSDVFSLSTLGDSRFNFGVGASYSNSTSTGTSEITYHDLNGDGLQDQIINRDGATFVRYNLGSQFGTERPLLKSRGISVDYSEDAQSSNSALSLSLSFYLSIPIIKGILYAKAGMELSGNIGSTISESQMVFQDVNGDGFADIVKRSGNDLVINFSKIGKTNKLKSVKTIQKIGNESYTMNEFSLGYAFTKPTYAHPSAKLVLSEVKVNNPNAYTYNYLSDDAYQNRVHRFRYENGKYDRRERAFFGFRKVITEELKSNKVYRKTEDLYYNHSYFLHGTLESTTVLDENDTPLTKVENAYELKKFKNQNTLINHAAYLPLSYDTGGTEGRKMAIALLKSTTTTQYETGGMLQSTEYKNYDDKGLLIRNSYRSNSAAYDTDIIYHDLPTILGVPKEVKVYIVDGNQRTLRRHRATVIGDAQKGQIAHYITYTGTGAAYTSYDYDTFGNITRVQYPANANGERYTLQYVYDGQLSKYPIRITDSFGYQSESQYEPLFDNVLMTRDWSGNEMHYEYDSRGRITVVNSPYQQGSSFKTIRYEYSIVPRIDKKAMYRGKTTFFHRVNDGSILDIREPIVAYTFSDALMRSAQVKKYRVIEGILKMSISGMAYYDGVGRVVREHHPVHEDVDVTVNEKFSRHYGNYYTESYYDAKDRIVKTVDETNHAKKYFYTIEQGKLKVETEENQNTSTQIKTTQYYDTERKMVETVSYLGQYPVRTKMYYNGIGELQYYTDAENITTNYFYNLTGAKTQVRNPNYGSKIYHYDLAGNLIRYYAAEMAVVGGIRSSGKYIQYQYHYNRLTAVTFPNLPNNIPNPSNVSYTYGPPNSGNGAGKVIRKTYDSGYTEYQYGKLGEVTQEKTSITGIGIPTVETTMHFDYDTFGRLYSLTYPDGELVMYHYDDAGYLEAVRRDNGGNRSDLIRSIYYNNYGQRTQVLLGNGLRQQYEYRPTDRALKRNHIIAPYGDVLDLRYRYDHVGNIVTLDNLAPTTRGGFGLKYRMNFEYDTMNRLGGVEKKPNPDNPKDGGGGGNGIIIYGKTTTQKTKDPEGEPELPVLYTTRFRYTDTGNILYKEQRYDSLPVYNPLAEHKMTYEYVPNTQKLRFIESSDYGRSKYIYGYDRNGNVLWQENDRTQERKQFFWDELDRLKGVDVNEKYFQYYTYNDAGNRTIKYHLEKNPILYQNGALVSTNYMYIMDYKVYPNAYYNLSADGMAVHHYYIDGERIASRVNYLLPSSPTSTKNENTSSAEDLLQRLKDSNLPTEIEVDISTDRKVVNRGLYYLHNDHLGTSSFVTDGDGDPTQFYLNFPFGETLYEQQNTNAYENPYKFNAKELDDETGLYYYGARYYDPRIGMWLSVDPLTEKMPSWSPYAYAFDNPVRFIDPDGRAPWPPENGYEGQVWKDGDGSFINRNGTWYRDNGAFMGFLCGNCRYESVNTINTNGTPGYDGRAMLSSSNYDYTYDLMPGKQIDDVNYWNNGDKGVMMSRILETTLRDAIAVENRTTTIEAITVVSTSRNGGRMNNKLKPNSEAVGSHTTFRRNDKGEIYKYETYQRTTSGYFNPRKRYDGGRPDGTPGKPHVNKRTGQSIPTPHVQGNGVPGGVRAAKEWEIPKHR
ncbi:RHS repeat-associated core domain-containing protein [Bergeyella zoohelcum]|nr:RHS repeat-associated core domain-containing protein [Bergeyella zoohelcum]